MKKLYLAFIVLFSITAYAQPVVGFQPIITGLSNPLDIVNPGDGSGRLFIVEQTGKIKIWNGTSVLATPFFDAASVITYGGEQGLLSLAFHPNYATNRYFFIYYNNKAGNVTVARYQTKAGNSNEADPTTGVVLLSISKRFSNHNGGKLNFGSDGYLYFATGDGGSGGDPDNNAQTGSSLLGKMLRIDVNNFSTPPYYTIPATNPYFGSTSVRNEVLALGLRNPFRWSFDRQTGDMWIADVGQNLYEEVNIKTAATLLSPTNYGWRCIEGMHQYTTCTPQTPSNNVLPIFEYGHNSTNGGYSITGGYVYRGTEYPSLQGYYLCNDYVTNKGWLIKPNGSGGWTTTLQNTWAGNIAGYGEAADGTLYAASLSDGTVYKLTATPAVLPVKLVSFTGDKTNNQHKFTWNILQEQNGDSYELQQSINNTDNFITLQTIKVAADKNSNSYSFAINASAATSFYRLKIVNKQGVISYSSIISFGGQNIKATVKAYKTTGAIRISSNQAVQHIMVTDITGRTIYCKPASGMGDFSVPFNGINSGILVVHVLLRDGSKQTIKLAN